MEFNSNTSCIIEKNSRKNKKKVMLNINTRFRNNYYNQSSTDFNIDLPYNLTNIMNLSLNSFECNTKIYTFSEKLKTNEFTIETYYYDLNGKEPDYEKGPQEIKLHTIKIKEGIYTGQELEKYLNINVFSAPGEGTQRYRNFDIQKITENVDPRIWDDDFNGIDEPQKERMRIFNDPEVQQSFIDTENEAPPAFEDNPTLNIQEIIAKQNELNQSKAEEAGYFTNEAVFFNVNQELSKQELKRILCRYDPISNKIHFFRDMRTIGGQPDIKEKKTYKFNISWLLKEQPNRPIQLNMGWILGFRKQYYNNDDYITRKKITTSMFEGYNAECQYKKQYTNYVLLSINDFNKSKGDTVLSPFQESSYTDGEIIAKLCIDNNTIKFKEGQYDFIKREYYGPVNIKKMKIKLLDEFGRNIDLDNSDYSFSLMMEQIYD
tara:strand:+ start:2175 stop:3473 length:1299 start_codon:yes stop_codon:yes gene_type:complete